MDFGISQIWPHPKSLSKGRGTFTWFPRILRVEGIEGFEEIEDSSLLSGSQIWGILGFRGFEVLWIEPTPKSLALLNLNYNGNFDAMLSYIYKTNKPLVNSLFMGVAYFFFCWSIDFNEEIKGLFANLMLFLPGITFPLTTSYFKLRLSDDFYKELRIYGHLFLSLAIYHGSVWIYTGEGATGIAHISILAGALGSFFYLLTTKFLLKSNFTPLNFLLGVFLSGLAFLPHEIIENDGLWIGVAVLAWTLINGFVLNIEFRKI